VKGQFPGGRSPRRETRQNTRHFTRFDRILAALGTRLALLAHVQRDPEVLGRENLPGDKGGLHVRRRRKNGVLDERDLREGSQTHSNFLPLLHFTSLHFSSSVSFVRSVRLLLAKNHFKRNQGTAKVTQ
jgi:hypothetical protein